MLNPYEVHFDGNDNLLATERGSRFSVIAIPNEIFNGALKILDLSNGSQYPDVGVKIIKGPPTFLNKKCVISARSVNNRLFLNTLCYDSQGIYIEGVWVFAKRGNIVRLIEYKT